MPIILILLVLLAPALQPNRYTLTWTSPKPATHATARSSTGFDPYNHISSDGRSGTLAVEFERACLTIEGEVFYADGSGSFPVKQTWAEGCVRVWFPLVEAPPTQ